MNTNILLTTLPHTSNWSIQTAIIMSVCNLICIGIGRYAIQVRGLGPSIPILGLEGFGLPELLATTSLGHAVGAGTIIGLSTIGLI
uniref:Photosystem I reaction center subunit PsaK n=4 Tax=Halymeniaceae TaxID=31453 RepID=A0A6F8ULT8_9FLOR|nr:photosystem I reaction center subunit PsaK [Grateloupia taiwanensis]YP_009488587.1 photosystem I reaction center subunit PsaK [Grateloupia filicina]YP_010502314.1 Photosystem I reaction center subunit psaK [Grateloupia turuturu]YP_010985828.1 photosystem I reaction center subunit X [Grateloupia asiatica]AGO19841.1 photosystem I reaction center subunit PsaK [Grateloupia taiwanensis]AWD77418.1 photosystem I reaction center subunit PsaK [Grateloupia filicina]QHD45183.1 photosystem I reaction 